MNVRIDGVRVRRAGRDVLAIPRLDIRAGRTTAILGPNGAGKTTLLRLIAGLERPHEGRVLVADAVADVRRHLVAYVFQEEVFLRRSLLDNLTLGLRVRGASRVEAHDRAMAALRLLGVETLAGRRADRISGGEARRASLARALCLAAPLLLLDEPMAGLDGRTYTRLVDELPGLLATSGATTLLVTHDRGEAFRLCDDLVVLLDGQVIAAGAKRDIATDPRRADVAGALGYAVLVVDGRRVAIPDGGLRFGPGERSFPATVETVLDAVWEWDIIAMVEQSRVHVRLPRADTPPASGDRIALHAPVMYELA
jgi:ABC-type sulfate/molybdate transport systems ATPase subunit